MLRNGRLILGFGFVAMFASGCGVAVTEAQMQDRTQAVQIAQKRVKSYPVAGTHVKRIAVIGISTPNQIKEYGGGVSIGGTAGAIVGAVNAAKSYSDMAKAIACRALEATFAEYTTALAADGFELVSPAEKLADPKFSLFASGGPEGWCYASAAPARLAFLNPFKWKDTFRVIQDLITDLGVDGVIMGQVGANGIKTGEETISLYVKNADGVARVGWSGRIPKGRFKFEPALPGETDEAKLANATRIFKHSFVLFSAKMASEAK